MLLWIFIEIWWECHFLFIFTSTKWETLHLLCICVMIFWIWLLSHLMMMIFVFPLLLWKCVLKWVLLCPFCISPRMILSIAPLLQRVKALLHSPVRAKMNTRQPWGDGTIRKALIAWDARKARVGKERAGGRRSKISGTFGGRHCPKKQVIERKRRGWWKIIWPLQSDWLC